MGKNTIENIKVIFCTLLIGGMITGLALLADKYQFRRESKTAILKSKNIETHINHSSYYFMYDNGHVDCVDMQKYMSYEVGDEVVYY